MKIGYVQVGAPWHGVTRYGRLLAAEARDAEARERADLIVLECEVELSGNRREDRRCVLSAGRTLAEADLVHLQYNNQSMGCVWGPRWRQFLNLTRFARALRVPMVATVHDIYRPRQPGYYWMARHPIGQIQNMSENAPPWATLRWLCRRASALFVSSEEEGRRLEPPHSRVRVIPLCVERRELTESAEEARRALGLRGRRVVTLLGFIHERKGHRLLIEALATLPPDVVVIAAGGPAPAGTLIPSLLELAQVRGVADRFRVTGYLSEHELNRYLAATSLAVCPFRDASASASLSTWISAARPILASSLPLIAEYNALEPDAIRTFHPYTAASLADAIRAALDRASDAEDQRVARLRERLLAPAILDRHVEAYRELLGANAPTRR
jgi:glycosyltransferase involved in cell wall biosynthesis